VIELSGGYLHASMQPERAMAAALARAGRRPGAWQRPPMDGLPELREWFAREIGGPAGTVAAAEVLITAGGQSALTAALRALAPPGAPVLVESPTYSGMLAAARASGLRPVPVPVDADGVRPELLAEAFRASGARMFVCQPLFQNPTGAVLTPERGREVLRVARAAGAFVVEDDYARRLVHEDAGPLPPTLAAQDPDGVVVHISSLTKATSPSLRVGALAARGPAFRRLSAIQVVDSFFVPRPLQEAALELVGSPAWSRHLRTVRRELRARREALLSALARDFGDAAVHPVPPGGFTVWLRLPEGTDEAALVSAALRAGVAVGPGRPYFAAEPPAPHLRLSFVAVAGPGEIAEGVRRLRGGYESLAR
jgi:DNA-binding transcriptional MocR family regulator